MLADNLVTYFLTILTTNLKVNERLPEVSRKSVLFPFCEHDSDAYLNSLSENTQYDDAFNYIYLKKEELILAQSLGVAFIMAGRL